MSILLATREMQGWLADSRTYDGQHKRGWLSAINDFERSAGHLGPDLRDALSQELVDAAAAASSLKTDFGSITSAPAIRTRLAAHPAADKQADAGGPAAAHRRDDPEGDKVVLSERLDTAKPVRIVLLLGISLPLHASANGKAVLAGSSAAVVEELLVGRLAQYTDTTITTPGERLADLQEIRGYATDSLGFRRCWPRSPASVSG